jgi:hypothetical protein
MHLPPFTPPHLFTSQPAHLLTHPSHLLISHHTSAAELCLASQVSLLPPGERHALTVDLAVSNMSLPVLVELVEGAGVWGRGGWRGWPTCTRTWRRHSCQVHDLVRGWRERVWGEGRVARVCVCRWCGAGAGSGWAGLEAGPGEGRNTCVSWRRRMSPTPRRLCAGGGHLAAAQPRRPCPSQRHSRVPASPLRPPPPGCHLSLRALKLLVAQWWALHRYTYTCCCSRHHTSSLRRSHRDRPAPLRPNPSLPPSGNPPSPSPLCPSRKTHIPSLSHTGTACPHCCAPPRNLAPQGPPAGPHQWRRRGPPSALPYAPRGEGGGGGGAGLWGWPTRSSAAWQPGNPALGTQYTALATQDLCLTARRIGSSVSGRGPAFPAQDAASPPSW